MGILYWLRRQQETLNLNLSMHKAAAVGRRIIEFPAILGMYFLGQQEGFDYISDRKFTTKMNGIIQYYSQNSIFKD